MKLREHFTTSEIFRPSILITIGTLALLGMSSYLPRITALVVMFSCICFFALGEFMTAKKIEINIKPNPETIRTWSLLIGVIAIGSLIADFYTAGGIPLLNPGLRRFLNPIFTSLAFLLVPSGACLITTFANKKHAKLKTIGVILFASALLALLGYRTEVLAMLIAGTITAYYSKIFKAYDLIIFAMVAILAWGGMTFMREGVEGLTGSVRTGTTLAAFDYVVEETEFMGMTHGYTQFSDVVKILSEAPILGGRVLIARIIGARSSVSITSTLFGPPFLDFGMLALIEFLFLGVLAGASYSAAKQTGGLFAASHGVVLTFLLLGLETGITDLIVWTYFGLTAIYLFYAHFKK